MIYLYFISHKFFKLNKRIYMKNKQYCLIFHEISNRIRKINSFYRNYSCSGFNHRLRNIEVIDGDGALV